MHIRRHKSQYRLAVIMIGSALIIIFMSLAVIQPPQKDVYLGWVKTFIDLGNPAAAYSLNPPEGSSQKPLAAVIDNWGISYTGFPHLLDGEVSPPAVVEFEDNKLICVIETLDIGSKIHLYDLFGGEFYGWPAEIEGKVTGKAAAGKINEEPVIVCHTENKIFAVNIWGNIMDGFPAEPPMEEDEILNSGVEIINNTICAGTNKGRYFIIGMDGAITQITTNVSTEQRITRTGAKFLRANKEGFQIIDPEGEYNDISLEDGIYDIEQPLTVSADENAIYAVTGNGEIEKFDQDGQPDPGFDPMIQFTQVFSPPAVDTEGNVIFGGDRGMDKWEILQYDSKGQVQHSASLPAPIYSQPAFMDKDIVYPLSSGNLYRWDTNNPPEIFWQPPEPDSGGGGGGTPSLPAWTGLSKTNYTVVFTRQDKDKVGNWYIYDYIPPGASITWNSTEQAVQFAGAGTQNGYRYNITSANAEKFKGIGWSMKYGEPFIVYIDCNTTEGHRYLYYTSAETDNGPNPEGTYIHYGLGKSASGGKWSRFYRNLEEDLQAFQPDNEILKINAFLIRGSGLARDIYLFNADILLHDKLYEAVQDMKEYPSKTTIKRDSYGRITEKLIATLDTEGNILKQQKELLQYHKNGKVKRREIVYYAGTTPVSSRVYIYNEQGRFIEYQSNMLAPDGAVVSTWQNRYGETETTDGGTKKSSYVNKSYYCIPAGGITWKEIESVYDAENRLKKRTSRIYECIVEGNLNVQRGDLLYIWSYKYFYEDKQNTMRLSKYIMTAATPAGSILSRNTYTDLKYTDDGRLWQQRLIIEKPGSPLHKAGERVYTYLYNSNTNQRMYKYMDGEGILQAAYQHIYDKGWHNIKRIYGYKTYSYIYENYMYNKLLNRLIRYTSTIKRKTGEFKTENYRFYNKQGDIKRAVSIGEETGTVTFYAWDNVRRLAGYTQIKASAAQILSLLQGPEEEKMNSIEGDKKIVYEIKSRNNRNAVKDAVYRYYDRRDGIWELTYTVEMKTKWNKQAQRTGLNYTYRNAAGHKTREYIYTYNPISWKLTEAVYKYYTQMGGGPYYVYRYKQKYKEGTPRIRRRDITIERYGEPSGRQTVIYTYDKEGKTKQSTQYVYAAGNRLVEAINKTLYFYNGYQFERQVQFRYKVEGKLTIDEAIAGEGSIKLADIGERRNLVWEKNGWIKKWINLWWDKKYKLRLSSGKKLDTSLARKTMESEYTRDKWGCLNKLTRKYKTRGEDIFYTDRWLYKSFPAEYRREYFSNNQKMPYYTFETEYNYSTPGILSSYTAKWGYKNSVKRGYENKRIYNDKGFLSKWVTSHFRIENGNKFYTVKNKVEQETTNMGKLQKRTLYSYTYNKDAGDKGGLWIPQWKILYSHYKWQHGRLAHLEADYYPADLPDTEKGDKPFIHLTDNLLYNQTGSLQELIYTYTYPNSPDKHYTHKYTVRLNQNGRTQKTEGNIMVKGNLLYTYTGDYTYKGGLLSARNYRYLYPDGQIEREYRYNIRRGKWNRVIKYTGEFLLRGNKYCDYEAEMNPATGMITEQKYSYPELNMLRRLYKIKYNRQGRRISYITDTYKDMAMDKSNLINRTIYTLKYGKRQYLRKIEGRSLDKNNILQYTTTYNYTSDRVYAGYQAVNAITNGHILFRIKDRFGTQTKTAEKITSNSPPSIYSINYILDEYGRRTGLFMTVTDKSGRRIRTEKQNWDISTDYITSWEKMYFQTDGYTVKEKRTCSNIDYLNQFYIGTETVEVHTDNSGSYTKTVEHVYDKNWLYIQNKVTTSTGERWTEFLDPVTGSLLYRIYDNGTKEGGGDASGSTSPGGFYTGAGSTGISTGMGAPTTSSGSQTYSADPQPDESAQNDIQEISAESAASSGNFSNPDTRFASGLIVLPPPAGQEQQIEEGLKEAMAAEEEDIPGVETITGGNTGGGEETEAQGPGRENSPFTKDQSAEKQFPYGYGAEPVFGNKRYTEENAVNLITAYINRTLAENAQASGRRDNWLTEFINRIIDRLISMVKGMRPALSSVFQRIEKNIDIYRKD